MEYSIIKVKTINELKSKVSKAKNLVVVEGGSDIINRAVLEDKRVDILLSPEKNRKNDLLYVRDSGLNHVLCKLAHKNKIAIGFNFSDVIKSKEREVLIGRMMQNIKLCRKYKVDMVFDCFDKCKVKNLSCFARILGMSPGEAKKALNFKKKNKSLIKEV